MARTRLLLERGDTLSRTVLWSDSSDEPIDLTGYIVTCNITVGEVSIDLTEGAGIEVDEDAGEIAISLTPEETSEFTEHFGKWKLYVLSAYTGQTLAEGMAFVSFYE